MSLAAARPSHRALLAMTRLVLALTAAGGCTKKPEPEPPPAALAPPLQPLPPPPAVFPALPEPRVPAGWPKSEVVDAMGRHVRCGTFEGLIDVYGWTSDSTRLAYRSRMNCFNPCKETSCGSFTIDFGVVVDTRNDTRARYVIERDGDTPRATLAKFGTLEQWEKWRKENPVGPARGRPLSPDGKRTARLDATKEGARFSFTPGVLVDDQPVREAGTLTCLTDPPDCREPTIEPHWAPDGRHLAYAIAWPFSKRGGGATLNYLIVMNTDPAPATR